MHADARNAIEWNVGILLGIREEIGAFDSPTILLNPHFRQFAFQLQSHSRCREE